MVHIKSRSCLSQSVPPTLKQYTLLWQFCGKFCRFAFNYWSGVLKIKTFVTVLCISSSYSYKCSLKVYWGDPTTLDGFPLIFLNNFILVLIAFIIAVWKTTNGHTTCFQCFKQFSVLHTWLYNMIDSILDGKQMVFLFFNHLILGHSFWGTSGTASVSLPSLSFVDEIYLTSISQDLAWNEEHMAMKSLQYNLSM